MSSYSIDSLEQYFKVYRKSVNKPKKFWGKIAENNFTWYQKWDKVVWNFPHAGAYILLTLHFTIFSTLLLILCRKGDCGPRQEYPHEPKTVAWILTLSSSVPSSRTCPHIQ